MASFHPIASVSPCIAPLIQNSGEPLAAHIAIMPRFAHIHSDIPFLVPDEKHFIIAVVLHIVSNLPDTILPSMYYWVTGKAYLSGAITRFKVLGYDIVKSTLTLRTATNKPTSVFIPTARSSISILMKGIQSTLLQ